MVARDGFEPSATAL